MIDDVFEILRAKSNIDRVQHTAHTGRGPVRLKVTAAIPHERADTIADLDASTGQRMCQLMRTSACLAVGLATHAIFCCRDDFFVWCHDCTALNQLVHEQLILLHSHEWSPSELV